MADLIDIIDDNYIFMLLYKNITQILFSYLYI